MFCRYILLFLLLISFPTIGQEKIEYDNRQLNRSLRKSDATEFKNLQEMDLQVFNGGEDKISGKFFKVPEKNSQIRYIYVGRVNSCRAGGCSVSGPARGDRFDSEYFDYFILFNKNGQVEEVKVFNYEATHGYEITSRGWLRQFEGYKGEKELQVSKNIDAISGATISVHAITDDIIVKTKVLQSEI